MKILKKVYFLIGVVLCTVYMLTGCNSDADEINSKSDYSFSIRASVYDYYGMRNGYYDELTVESLQEGDAVSSKTELDPTSYSDYLKIDFNSSGKDGVSTHKAAIKWKYNNLATTDTLLCEVHKNGENISIEKIWVNGLLQNISKYDTIPSILIYKVDPEILKIHDINNKDSKIEKTIDDLTYEFWLSDTNDNVVTSFNEQDGFIFNAKLTNNNKDITYRVYDYGYIFGVFNLENQYVGSSKKNIDSIVYISNIIEIKPGESYTVSNPYDANASVGAVNLLPAGKYFTYYYEKFLVIDNRISEGATPDPRIYYRTTPPFILNFEIR